jgi:hypothetical protein
MSAPLRCPRCQSKGPFTVTCIGWAPGDPNPNYHVCYCGNRWRPADTPSAAPRRTNDAKWSSAPPTSGEWFWVRKLDGTFLYPAEVVRVVIHDGRVVAVERIGDEPDDGWEYKPEGFLWGPEVKAP